MMWIQGLLLLGAVSAIALLCGRWRWNAFFTLVGIAAVVSLGNGFTSAEALQQIRRGMGQTVERIGLLIVLGATLGSLLEHSGAAVALARAVLQRTGHHRAPLALSGLGVVIGLPIFCDVGFLVLAGLVRSLANQAPTQRVSLVVSLATALYAVHCLTPPHPGITAAASTMGLSASAVLGPGIAMAIIAAAVGWGTACYFLVSPVTAPTAPEAAERNGQQTALPSLTSALLPVVVPVIWLAAGALIQNLSAAEEQPNARLALLGEPAAALAAGILCALPLLRRMPALQHKHWLDDAFTRSGHIVLITAAGGAFGEVIKAMDIGQTFGPLLAASDLSLIVPFALAALLKTAQGSATVAVMTTAGILLPLLPALGFHQPGQQTIALLAMGAGSMFVSHANDSYFWVVARFGNLDTTTTLHTYTLATAAMSLAAGLTLYLLWQCS